MNKRYLPALLLLTILPAFTQAQNAWTNSFDIVIFNRSIPSVSPGSISIKPKPLDDFASGTIDLSNTGNKAAGFTIEGLPPGLLNPTWTAENGWQPINAREDDRTDEPIPLPDSISLGFTFRYFGNDFTSLKILQDGRIQLDGSRQNELRIFYDRSMTTSLENIRYRQEENRVVVSWIDAYIPPSADLEFGLTNLNFQIQLYKSGEIRYLYGKMNGAQSGDAAVGYIGDGSSFVDVSFDENDDGASSFQNVMAILNQQSWFSVSAEANPVGPVSTNALTLRVDNNALTELGLNGKLFNLNVNWDNGSSDVIAVTVVKENPNNLLEVLPSTNPLNLPVNAPLGTVTITNSGNTKLDFSILNTAAQTANNYAWSPSSFLFDDAAGPEFIPTDVREGVSELVPLSFPFPYFGKYYTTFSISVNGYIMLGTTNVNDSAPIIAPYWNDLAYTPSISKISMVGDTGLNVITWKDMNNINITDGRGQTFQVILESDGKITFQYKLLDGTNIWATASDFRNTLIYMDYLETPSNYGGRDEPPIPPEVHKAIGLKTGGEVTIARNSVSFTGGSISETNLIWSPGGDSDQGTVKTTEVVTETYIPVGDNEYGAKVLLTNTVVVYDDPLINQAFTFTPSATATPFSFSPVLGSLWPGETRNITVDARGQSAGTSGSYQISSQDPSPPSFTVNVTAASPAPLMDRDLDGQSDFAELLAGTDPLDAESNFSVHSASSANADGSRTITWTAPNGDLPKGRTYTIWYTTNLLDGWQELATVTTGTSYTDTGHRDVPAIYYKVSVD